MKKLSLILKTAFAPMVVIVVALAMSQTVFAQNAGHACVWQDADADMITDNFVFQGVAGIYDRSSESAVDVYSYGFPENASYNGSPPAISNVSQMFLVQTNDGPGPSLFHVHDKPDDGTGGEVETAYKLLGGDTATILETDGEGSDSFIDSSPDFSFYNIWLDCCTDGGVIGTLEGDWTLDAHFVAFGPFDPPDGPGIGLWQVTSQPLGAIPLVLETDRRARLRDCSALGGIDLKPGSNPNCVNPDSGGMVSVAILTTEDFDALSIDDSTIDFGGAEAFRCEAEDAGADLGLGDGDLDLICRFRKRDVTSWPEPGMDCDLVELTAEGYDGSPFAGGALACLAGEPTCATSTPTP
jgi:hypothetical protein